MSLIPGRYDLRIYKGSTYYGPLIKLPDLAPFGGPSTLSDPVVVTAALRRSAQDEQPVADFEVDVVDPLAREVRLGLTKEQAASLAIGRGVWDLQVVSGEWEGTVLAGEYLVIGQVTR